MTVSLASRSFSDFDNPGLVEDKEELVEVDVDAVAFVVREVREEVAFVTVAFIVRDCVVLEDTVDGGDEESSLVNRASVCVVQVP